MTSSVYSKESELPFINYLDQVCEVPIPADSAVKKNDMNVSVEFLYWPSHSVGPFGSRSPEAQMNRWYHDRTGLLSELNDDLQRNPGWLLGKLQLMLSCAQYFKAQYTSLKDLLYLLEAHTESRLFNHEDIAWHPENDTTSTSWAGPLNQKYKVFRVSIDSVKTLIVRSHLDQARLYGMYINSILGRSIADSGEVEHHEEPRDDYIFGCRNTWSLICASLAGTDLMLSPAQHFSFNTEYENKLPFLSSTSSLKEWIASHASNRELLREQVKSEGISYFLNNWGSGHKRIGNYLYRITQGMDHRAPWYSSEDIFFEIIDAFEDPPQGCRNESVWPNL